MQPPDYGATVVRADIREAHRRLWEHLRAAGSWWTGAERVAIAAEARGADGCELCAARKAALSPSAVQGEHRSVTDLRENVVEVIHRVRTDPARLTRAWFDTVIAAGLAVPAYVEVVAIVTMLTGIDYFARALGVSSFPLPEPLPGESSRYLPASATAGTAWVPMIAPEDAAGAEADLYPPNAMVPNIVRALSVVPAEARALQMLSAAHYLPVEQIVDPTARRALERPQMELIAARVSALNQCFY
jgi:hypothetical protein